MSVQSILNKLNFLPGLGLNSAELTPDEERRMLELATEMRKIYDEAVARYRRKIG